MFSSERNGIQILPNMKQMTLIDQNRVLQINFPDCTNIVHAFKPLQSTSTQFLWLGKEWLFREAAHVYQLLFPIWGWDRPSVEMSQFFCELPQEPFLYQSILRFSCFSYHCIFFFESNLESPCFVPWNFPTPRGFFLERYQCGGTWSRISRVFRAARLDFQTANFEQWLSLMLIPIP